MNNVEKRRKVASTGTAIKMAVILIASVLLTGCGSSKSAGSSANASQQPEYKLDDSCALIHIYRTSSLLGAAISYTVNLDDEPLFKVKRKSKMTVKVTKEGEQTLWGKTEAREELTLDVKLGEEYYVRCSLTMGVAVGRPYLELVDADKGKAEFNKIP